MSGDKLKRAGLTDPPRPTKTNPDELNLQKESDLLKFMEGVFLAPTLSLVQIYLYHSNGSRKTIENCTFDFRAAHPDAWKTIFALDFFFRLVYMTIVLIVVIRGLAIGDYITNLFNLKQG